jgi:hypothetical protein
MFTTPTGAALNPDWISRRLKELAAEAGLPVIKFPCRAAHRGDARASGERRNQDRERDARPFHDVDYRGSLPAGDRSDADRRRGERYRAAAGTQAEDRLMTAGPHCVPIIAPIRATGQQPESVSASQRRAWDSNPRYPSRDTAVFKTALAPACSGPLTSADAGARGPGPRRHPAYIP